MAYVENAKSRRTVVQNAQYNRRQRIRPRSRDENRQTAGLRSLRSLREESLDSTVAAARPAAGNPNPTPPHPGRRRGLTSGGRRKAWTVLAAATSATRFEKEKKGPVPALRETSLQGIPGTKAHAERQDDSSKFTKRRDWFEVNGRATRKNTRRSRRRTSRADKRISSKLDLSLPRWNQY